MSNSHGWIPVSERMPELYKDVLIATWRVGSNGGWAYDIEKAHWWGEDGSGWWTGYDSVIWHPEEVTHWQPLPEPPQINNRIGTRRSES